MRRAGPGGSRSFVVLLGMTLVAALLGAPASGAADIPPHAASAGVPDAGPAVGPAAAPAAAGTAGATATSARSYLLPLSESPLAAESPGRSLAERGIALAGEQERAAATIAAVAPTATVVRRLAVAWNGLEVLADAAAAAALRRAGFPLVENAAVEAFLSRSVPQVRATEVWSRTGANGLALTGHGVSIAILDTGVDYSHGDLGGCFGAGCKVTGGYDVVNGDADPRDDHGHGTHVAAIAAGSGLYKGVAPGATIRAYKVLGANSSGTVAAVLEGIDRAVDPNRDGDVSDGADVVNISLGCTDWGLCDPDDPLSSAVDTIVRAGIVVVAAAGNSSWVGVASPATARSAIAVGASDGATATASFSGEGPTSWNDQLLGKPDLVAPGVGICAARWSSYAPTSVCHAGGRHTRQTGSSMAAPHVAGAAALLLQARPTLTPVEVKAALRATARPIPEYNNSGTNLGAGLLDVAAAVDAVGKDVPVVELAPISAREWPRRVRASVQAANVTGWRLEAAGLHSPTWSTVTSGTSLPAGGVFHEFAQPVYATPGPRLRLVVETGSGARGIDYSWVAAHADHSTPVLGATTTGMTTNGWSNGTRALLSDDQYAEAADNPAADHIAVDLSRDGGQTWQVVAEKLPLPRDVDARVSGGLALTGVPASALTPAAFRLRVRTATGLVGQDFGGFDLRVPANAVPTALVVFVEGHRRDTTDPVAGQAVTTTRRIDDIAVKVRYRLPSGPAAPSATASYTTIDDAPPCELSCTTEPQVAVRSDGRPVVAYRDIANDSLKLLVCGDAACRNGNAWTQVDGAPGCSAGCGPLRNGFPSVSLALRADNRPVIAYISNDAPDDPYSRDLRLVSCGDATCRSGNTYVRFDLSGYEPPPPQNCILIYCYPTGEAPPPRTSAGTATLALNPNGIPVLAFAARVPNGEDTAVRVLTCSSATCQGSVTVATVEGPGCVGLCDSKSEVVWPISLAFRPDGRPLVAYQQQYVWSGGQRTSAARIRMITCGDTTCRAGNLPTMVSPHTSYAPVVRLQRNGLPSVTFLGGNVPQPQLVTCRTPTCAGPFGGDQLYAMTALDGWGPCAPGCNVRTSHGFTQATVLSESGAPILAVHDERATSLKLIRCGDAQCGHGTSVQHVDGAPGCPSGCAPTARTGFNPSLARRASDAALVVAYRDATSHTLRLAIVSG